MIAPDWLLYTLTFLCGVFFAASVLIADLDDSNCRGREMAEAAISKLAANTANGKFSIHPFNRPVAIDIINTLFQHPAHNKPINKPEPEMNTARQQFNTIQEARAFFAKARANRQTRHGYYQCADTLRARLNQHSRFVIGTEYMQ